MIKPENPPAIRMLELFSGAGVRSAFSDPWVGLAPPTCAEWLEQRESVELSPEALESYDAVVLATDHCAFDYELIARHARLVVDTRNAFAHLLSGDARYVRA